jgi:hypothetical protein
MLDISGLWTAPFRITRRDLVVTFGSCFAQHFGPALKAQGYHWHVTEPTPGGLSETSARRLGYSAFSARTGNIYTTSLFHQWVDWALGERVPPTLSWQGEAGVHDPFRPTIEPGGFGSEPEMLAARDATIAAFRRAILGCNVLVFTLGLTESWHDRELGVEYPICPGVAAGSFDPDRHVFENMDYEAVHANLVQAIRKIRTARGGRGPRILLTVSPVPLTATMSGDHVLVASSDSKAVLRAVAGAVARSLPYVSYFPAYEIISSPPFRGAFFEPNMRSVNRAGVAHVMTQLFAALPDGAKGPEAGEAGLDPSTRHDPEQRAAEDEALICDEELLGAFGPRG